MCLAMGCCEGGALVKAVCLLAGCRPHARGWGVRVVKWLGGVGWVAGLDLRRGATLQQEEGGRH